MEYKIEVYSALCELSEFTINKIKATKDDFGNQFDQNPEDAEDYGCGNMTFEGKDYTIKVLNKYHITKKEYNEIVNILEDKLSFGNCGWCV